MGNHGDAHLLEGFRLYRRDRRFRRILAAWGLMGFANLMMLSLRVEYLANPRYGFMLTAVSVALVTTVLPNVARILMNPVWGRLFDRADFFSLRVVINLCFALSIACFFSGLGWTALVLGALLFGVASSGGEIAWSLWVTKFAAPSKVADYMAVHTFLTGVRGVIAPFLAFYALRILAPETLAFAAGALILWSCILLHRERRRPDKRPHAQPLTEEVVE